MLFNPAHLLFPLCLIFQQALTLFEPRAVGLAAHGNTAFVLPEHRNYGLFDRPAPFPVKIDKTREPDIPKINRQVDASISVEPVPTTATAMEAASITGASMTRLATAIDTAYALPTDLGRPLSDTYMLPPAYDSAQLSSLFSAESSVFAEASTLISALESGAGIECTGLPDVSGSEVTVCGPTGNPSATGKGENGAIEAATGRFSWGFTALGLVAGVAAFIL